MSLASLSQAECPQAEVFLLVQLTGPCSGLFLSSLFVFFAFQFLLLGSEALPRSSHHLAVVQTPCPEGQPLLVSLDAVPLAAG